MKWLRLYNETPNDPKWRVVAVRSGQPVGNVLAVWMQMLACASEAEERGTLEDWDDEIVAAMLGYAPATVTVIRASMQGLVLDGLRLTGWEKRQRQGSDDAADRKRRSRASKQENPPPGGGHGPNGADREADHDVTGQSRDNEDMSRDKAAMSQDSPVTPSRATQTQESNSVASATAPPAAPDASLKSELFGRCLVWLIASTGRKEIPLRNLIGRWIADHGEGAVLAAIVLAQRESAVSPVGYVEKVLRSGSKRHGQANGSKHDRLINGLARAFDDLVDAGPERSGGERRQLAIGYH